MKKIFLLLIIFILSAFITACEEKKTLEQLQEDFSAHIGNNKEVYESHIHYFNNISQNATKGVVSVIKTMQDNEGSSRGTGVIFDSDENYYFVLTNYHLIYTKEGEVFSYLVSDYNGNDYKATLVVGDSDYDLAILKFEKGLRDLTVVTLAEQNLPTDVRIAILGSPANRVNSITLGTILKYSRVETIVMDKQIINIAFEVMISDAPVKPGSSGSAILSDNLELVGLVYAGSFTDGIAVSNYTFAIPVEKIREFLIVNDFVMSGEEL